MEITRNNLKKTYTRLKKDTKHFSKIGIRDVFDFLDFDVTLESNLKNLSYHINKGFYKPSKVTIHTSAKGMGINRPTAVLGLNDMITYRYCIEQIEDDLLKAVRVGNRNKYIRGGRKLTITKRNNEEGNDRYEKRFEDWQGYINGIKQDTLEKNFAVSCDIASYFNHINLLTLIDLIRSNVHGKKKIIDLLFFFLEQTKQRTLYETNSYNGLLQETIDCSRLLAYFFLHPLDEELGNFTKETGAIYYRYVDDMVVLVNDKITAKKALKTITESLRKLELSASIEKSYIIEQKDIDMRFSFEENEEINILTENIITELKESKKVSESTKNCINKLFKNINKKENKGKLYKYDKILKRFYTLFGYIQNDYLLDHIVQHTINYPGAFWGFGDKRIFTYLVRCKKSKKINTVILGLISYLMSGENLYQTVETEILETIVNLDGSIFNDKTKEYIGNFAFNFFFEKENLHPQSEYAKAISVLLIYKYANHEVEKLADHFIKGSIDNELLKKYLIAVCLTINNNPLRVKVEEKTDKDHSEGVKSLISFIRNLNTHKETKGFKDYIAKDNIEILFDKKNILIEEKMLPTRQILLNDLVQRHGNST